MCPDSACEPREGKAIGLLVCSGWLAVSTAIAVMAYLLVHVWCTRSMEATERTVRRELLTEQMRQLRAGEIHCLCQPDPEWLYEVLADAACAENIHDVYLGGDVSDERLAQLKTLPHLSRLVFLAATNVDTLLERLHSMPTIEQVTCEQSVVGPASMRALREFPRLTSLTVPVGNMKDSDVQALAGHPVLETLVLNRIDADASLLPLLKSLPRLRNVTVEYPDSLPAEFEAQFHEAIPNCQCDINWTR
jgi:hypothetical protein